MPARKQAQLAIDPTAPEHVFDLQPALLGSRTPRWMTHFSLAAREVAGAGTEPTVGLVVVVGQAAITAPDIDVALEHGQQALGAEPDCRQRSPRRGSSRSCARSEIELVAVSHVAAALDDDVAVRLEQADQFLSSPAPIHPRGRAGNRSASITCSTKGSQEPTEASQASTSMPAHAAASHPLAAAATQIAHGRAGDGDQVSIQHRPLGLNAADRSWARRLARRSCVMPAMRPWAALGWTSNRRTMIRMALPKSQLARLVESRSRAGDTRSWPWSRW